MADAHVPERRRSPRAPAADGLTLTVSRTVRVRLMEISGDGALLAADEALPVHTTGRVFATLGAHRFEAEISVRRLEAGRTPIVHGVVLVPADQKDREALEEFLRRAGG